MNNIVAVYIDDKDAEKSFARWKSDLANAARLAHLIPNAHLALHDASIYAAEAALHQPNEGQLSR